MATTLQSRILALHKQAISREKELSREVRSLVVGRLKTVLKSFDPKTITITKKRQLARLYLAVQQIDAEVASKIIQHCRDGYTIQSILTEQTLSQAFDIQPDLSIAFVFPQDKLVTQSISKAVNNLNIKQRKNVRKLVSLASVEGYTVQQLSSQINKIVKTGKYHSTMIARTEMMATNNYALRNSYEQHNIEKVRWSARFDSRLCAICGSNANNVYPLNEAPTLPEHPACRCVLVPVTELSNKKRWKNFDSWLRKQPAETQRKVLRSDKKYKQFKAGKKTGEFVTKSGRIKNDDEV